MKSLLRFFYCCCLIPMLLTTVAVANETTPVISATNSAAVESSPTDAAPVVTPSLTQNKVPQLPTPTPGTHATAATPVPDAPTLPAKSYILQDYYSGQILAAKDPDLRVDPASLTKMMTVYVLDTELQKGKVKLDALVPISERAWRAEGSRMFIDVNTEVPVSDLRKGIIIQSGNDASIAIAEYIGGTETAFSELMNFHAKRLGMNNTHFMNATGLPDPNHYTTARDMAILARSLIHDYPESYALYSQKEFIYNKIKQQNRNLLLWRDHTVDGIKTGHTDDAGFCLVASAIRDNMRLEAVVMGAENENARAEQAEALLNYGFRFFKTYQLYSGQSVINQLRVFKGRQDSVNLGVFEGLYVTIPQGQENNLTTRLLMEKYLVAPVQAQQHAGTITVLLNGQSIHEQPLIALDTVEKGNIFRRCIDQIKLWFFRLFN